MKVTYGRAVRGAGRLAAAITLVAGLATPQTMKSLLDGTTPPGAAPGAQMGAFALTDLESINLFSGGLNVTVPLLTVGGRGEVRHTVSLSVENRWSTILATVSGGTQYVYPTDSGGRSTLVGYGPGYLEARLQTQEESCGATTYTSTTLLRLNWIKPDGSEQELVDANSHGTPQITGLSCSSDQQVVGTPVYYNRGTTFVTTDGSVMTFVSDSSTPITDSPGGAPRQGYLYTKDGTRYRIENGNVQWMSDRNGNLIRFVACSITAPEACTDSSSDRDPYNRPVRIIDPLGRVVRIEYGTPYGENQQHADEDRIYYWAAPPRCRIPTAAAPAAGPPRPTTSWTGRWTSLTRTDR